MNSPSKLPTIILVDDDPVGLKSAQRVFERAYKGRATVVTFSDPLLIEAHARTMQVVGETVILVSDGDMPGLEGPALLRLVRDILEDLFLGGCLYSGNQKLIEEAQADGFSTALKPHLDVVQMVLDDLLPP